MKHHDARRPIGKCKGCCLNQRTFCAAGLEPKAQWDRHSRCKHYGDMELLKRLASREGPDGAELTRLQRRERAAEAADVPHYNGVLDPGKMSGMARRAGRKHA